ncbi:hypothetical protein OHAE_1313 [Ochrobactrum soli]|uniref:Uncharacterized protein n=1 Tax=Ochrobactrum soli TaxID=2448455 RepID=A0A2P9HMV9_9HYPH|nr:hypothetical protein OHAE_1313 [[Ochrobactrum] soli]
MIVNAPECRFGYPIPAAGKLPRAAKKLQLAGDVVHDPKRRNDCY